MTLEAIGLKYQALEDRLKTALATMEKTDAIYHIREEIVELQNTCPHQQEDGIFTLSNGRCRFCGKKVVS